MTATNAANGPDSKSRALAGRDARRTFTFLVPPILRFGTIEFGIGTWIFAP